MEDFGLGLTVASLGMAIYVLGYGCGPLLFSPLSEIPAIGRTTVYIGTLGVFVILLIPTSLADNFAGFLVLRFLLGFFGSPCLANSGATFQDIFPPSAVFYIVAAWAAFATFAQAFGPLLTAYSVPVRGWRWSQWELLWLVGPVLILMIVALPETSASTILLRRARRLRAATGNNAIRAQSELDQAKLSIKEIAFDALIKPWEINILDPAVLYTTFYTGLVYGIFYTFFEVFPLVYQNEYHFDGGDLSLTFLAVAVCMLIVVPLYMIYFRIGLAPRIAKQGMPPLEDFLVVGLFTAWFLPAGLFIFGTYKIRSCHCYRS
ncbi:major facilitator superfamily domain-containing protein [Clohesyomyces aquaticus]|uniref:Major facilitator superfamily domain-containing protein n=1 Tax=Clohesyomyces aquaticus TaxID=1231657 RepID=A0A1Y1ZRP7_9PLEO|nr:major facilitator superfamily domain-containing protein [Clohesyomyces aquaticus]